MATMRVQNEMKKLIHMLLTVLLITLLPSLSWSTDDDDLVVRPDGLYYLKFTDVPFTGKVTGQTQGSYKNSIREGYFVEYHDNGQLKEKGSYKNGIREGDFVEYHDNGQIRWKGNWKNGEPEGDWVYYDENGKKRDL